MDHKRRHKVSKYLGKAINGYTKNPRRIREIVAVKGIYEKSHLELAQSLMPDMIGTLRKTFPDDHIRMFALPLTGLYIQCP